MSFKELVNSAVEKALTSREDLFLIDLKIDDASKITIVLDGDLGVNLQDCIEISRSVESNLDKEENDFTLEVMSSGASSPLLFPRQYKKNIGRILAVTTNESEKFEGQIQSADETGFSIVWKAREPKKIGKGKETVEKSVSLTYSQVKEAKVVISF